MKSKLVAFVVGLAASFAPANASESMARPKAGPVEILKVTDIKPGMQAVAWTVFNGTQPEPVPIEIIGLWRNVWGPRQDVILGKMGGKALRTNVAKGMSGSPVYVDGKLIGALSLGFSMFSPDAICGITPIELMLEIDQFDQSRPADAKTASLTPPSELLASAGISPGGQAPLMTPIEMPLNFAGFNTGFLDHFGPMLRQMGVTAVQGGAGGSLSASKPAAGWQSSLQPGEPIAGVLVSGDMSVTGLGTVTYNDGKKVLGFGHPFFNLGPVSMPMSKGEILMVMSSQFQPYKMGNATEIVGALTQDRHSGILGELGKEAPMIPVSVNVRSFQDPNVARGQKQFKFNVFVHQKWTPFLMMATLFNSISGLNEFMDEATYRLSGKVEIDGQPNLSLATMHAFSDVPLPAPMVLAMWWGNKFNRLFSNAVQTPRLKSVDVTVDLLPDRREAGIENAWVASNEVSPGDEVPVKVFLRPYRGGRLERDFKIKVPLSTGKGEHRILLSDADTLNRLQNYAGAVNRYIDLPQTVSLINQERSNNKLYVSLIQASPTAYYDDKTLPSLPSSILNVMQAGRASNRAVLTSPESAVEQLAIPFDYVVTGNYSLKINVK